MKFPFANASQLTRRAFLGQYAGSLGGLAMAHLLQSGNRFMEKELFSFGHCVL